MAVACIAFGFVSPILFLGGLFLLAELWYYQAIRWVDRHGNWS
jgi:hypothetical protein